jgi:hypothetical protein
MYKVLLLEEQTNGRRLGILLKAVLFRKLRGNGKESIDKFLVFKRVKHTSHTWTAQHFHEDGTQSNECGRGVGGGGGVPYPNQSLYVAVSYELTHLRRL